MKRKLFVIAVHALCAVLIGACGRGDDDDAVGSGAGGSIGSGGGASGASDAPGAGTEGRAGSSAVGGASGAQPPGSGGGSGRVARGGAGAGGVSGGGWGGSGSGDGGVGGMDGLLGEGEPCANNLQCASGFCWADAAAGDQPSQTTCRDRCLADSESEHVCNDDDDCCSGRCCVGCGRTEGVCEGGSSGEEICAKCSRIEDSAGACTTAQPVLWSCTLPDIPAALLNGCDDIGTSLPRYCCASDIGRACPP